MTSPTHSFHSARTLPRLFSWICFLCTFGLALSGIASSARMAVGKGQAPADINQEIKALQEQEAALKATQAYLEETLQKLKSGRYIFGPFKTSGTQTYFGLVEKDVYAGFIAVKMFQENKTAKDWVQAIRDMVRLNKAAIQSLGEELDSTKEALEGVQAKLAAYRKLAAKASNNGRPDNTKPRPRDGVSLELDSSTIDRKNAQNSAQWDVDKESGEGTYTPPWGKATFEFKMPDVIGPDGEKVKFGVTAKAKKGQRFGPAMVMVGDADLSPGNPQVYPVAESDMTADEFKEVTITPRKYSDETKFVYIQVRFQDGPTITYKYRVVR